MMTVVIRKRPEQESIKKLTEAITLQAIEDMCNPLFINENVEFLREGGLGICMEIIDLDDIQRKKLLRILCMDKVKKNLYVSQGRQICYSPAMPFNAEVKDLE